MIIYTNECKLHSCKDKPKDSDCHSNLYENESIVIYRCNKQGKTCPTIVDTYSAEEAITYAIENNKNLSLEDTLQLLKLKSELENQFYRL